MIDRERAAAAARRFFDEHRAGERFTGLPEDLRPRDIDEAHAIQDRLQALNEEHGLGPLAGWKVALTTPVMQQLAGIDHPCAGGIHEAYVYRSPVTLRAADYVRIGIEAEIAVRLSADLAGGGHTRNSVAAAVAAVAPSIEVVDDRACDYDALDGLALVADNSFNFGVVLGPETTKLARFWTFRRCAAVSSSTVTSSAKGGGEAVLGGHPFEAVAWLANALAVRGREPPGRGNRHDRQHRRDEVAGRGRRDRRRHRLPWRGPPPPHVKVQAMNIRYFTETDTLHIEFRDAPVAEESAISTRTRCSMSTTMGTSVPSPSSMRRNGPGSRGFPTSRSPPDGAVGGGSEPGHHEPRELLGEAPFLVGARSRT